MIEIKQKRIIIDGKPQIIMAGEIHYYRLMAEEWNDRIDKLIQAGCNAVSTYVPWLCHEEEEGKIDLDGTTRPELNLGKFIDLCKDKGLYFFLRPGPFIMAEMKNEGIPYWVIEKHPEIIPITWNGEQAPNPTLDYLAPNFLLEVDKWYQAVMAVVKPRLYQNGGNIIALQLDNEVGMLSWVSHSPDLTDHVLSDFKEWLKSRYPLELQQRYPFIDINFIAEIRSPKENQALIIMQDLGHYMRNRFARYIRKLREMAEKYGVTDIPFIVNIHGTSEGRGLVFPVGISQLYETYQDKGMISGSDIYFSDLTVANFEDLYIINGYMDAMHTGDQPLTSVEFNCGDGNFGDNFGSRMDPSAADFKARMCIAQGARLINYYLMAGGRNYRLSKKPHDGNDRIATTGERHGFAAPISPEGNLNYTFPRMAESIKMIMANRTKLSMMEEETDNVYFGFIPDYFMTESVYPESDRMKSMVRNLERNRAGSNWQIIGKMLLLENYRYHATDIQNKPLNPMNHPVLILGSAQYMSAEIQDKLVRYLENGGRLLLTGEVPIFDMEGNNCSILAAALGVTVKETVFDKPFFNMSIASCQGNSETRSYYAQTFIPNNTSINPTHYLYHNHALCGFESRIRMGLALVLTFELKADFGTFQQYMKLLGAKRALRHDYPHRGIFMTTMKNTEGEMFLHILNLDGLDKPVHLYLNEEPLFAGKELILRNKDALMLPLNVTYHDVTILFSTAEVTHAEDNRIDFRLTQPEDVILIKTKREIIESKEFQITKDNDSYTIKSTANKSRLTVRFQ